MSTGRPSTRSRSSRAHARDGTMRVAAVHRSLASRSSGHRDDGRRAQRRSRSGRPASSSPRAPVLASRVRTRPSWLNTSGVEMRCAGVTVTTPSGPAVDPSDEIDSPAAAHQRQPQRRREERHIRPEALGHGHQPVVLHLQLPGERREQQRRGRVRASAAQAPGHRDALGQPEAQPLQGHPRWRLVAEGGGGLEHQVICGRRVARRHPGAAAGADIPLPGPSAGSTTSSSVPDAGSQVGQRFDHELVVQPDAREHRFQVMEPVRSPAEHGQRQVDLRRCVRVEAATEPRAHASGPMTSASASHSSTLSVWGAAPG